MGKAEIKFSEQIYHLSRFLEHYFPQQKVHLMGMSYGGALAWGFALEHPETVECVALLNPLLPNPIPTIQVSLLRNFIRLPMPRPLIYGILMTPLGKLIIQKAAEIFRDERVKLLSEELRGRRLFFVCHVFQRFSWLVRQENWSSWIQKLKHWAHPTVIIYDQQDPLISEESYESFARMLSCDAKHVLSGAGHIATKLAGEPIARAVGQFLSMEKHKSAS